MSERNLQYNTLFTVDTDRSGLVDLEKSAERFGMRLRLSGRDFLRLGGSIGGVMNSMQSSLMGFLNNSMEWQIIMEDIGFAFEDIADVVMETLGPIFEVFVDYLDGLASYMEDNPWTGQLLAVGAILIFIIGIVGKGFTIFAKFYGILTLLVGTLITVSGAGLGIGDALTYLRIRLLQGEEASLRWLDANENLKKSFDVEGRKTIKDLIGKTVKEKETNNEKLAKLNEEESRILNGDLNVWNKMGPSFRDKLKGTPVWNQMEQEKQRLQEISKEKSDIYEQNGYLSTQEKLLRVSLKKGRALTQKEENKVIGKQKTQVKLWDRAKEGVGKYGKAIKGIGFAMGGGGLILGLITAWEPMMELFEAIGDAINTALEPLEPVMESFIEWIEENPTFTTALTALFGLILTALPSIMSLVGGLLGGGATAGTGGLLGSLGGVGGSLTGILSAAGPVVLVIGAIIFEVWKLIEFFKALFDVWGDMGSWVMQALNDPLEFISRLVVTFGQALNETIMNFPITRWIMELFGLDPDKLKQTSQNFWSDVMGSGVGVLELLQNSVKTVFSSIAESFGIPAGSFGFLFDLIKSFVQFLLGDTVGSFNTLQGAMGQIGTVVSEITNAFGGFINWVGNGFQWLIDVMKPVIDFFNGAWSGISGFFNSVGSFFGVNPVSNIIPATPLGINTMSTVPYNPMITPQAIAKNYESKTVPDINVTFNGVIDDRSAKTIADRLQKEFTKVLGRIN